MTMGAKRARWRSERLTSEENQEERSETHVELRQAKLMRQDERWQSGRRRKKMMYSSSIQRWRFGGSPVCLMETIRRVNEGDPRWRRGSRSRFYLQMWEVVCDGRRRNRSP